MSADFALEHHLLDALPGAVVATDLDGRIRYANAHAQRIYGWPEGDLLGRTAGELMGVNLPTDTETEIFEALSDGRTWEGDFELKRGDGSTMWVRATDAPLTDEFGNLIGVVSLVSDHTKAAAMAEELSARRQGEAKQRFLLEASLLLSSSLDFETALRRLAELVVPGLADLCLLDILEGHRVRRVAAVHADPAKFELAAELLDRPPEPAGAHPAAVVIRTGQSQMSAEMNGPFMESITVDAEHLRVTRALGFTSYVSVPLVARGRTLGALTLVSAGSGRRFDGDDLAMAEDLGRRAALMLDNARVYSERAHVARSLQASLLPPTLPDIPGFALAARYRAAGEGNEVGGDFYDVFELGFDAWALAIGDVCGKGPESAAITGLVRHALRGLAVRERNPSRLLEALDEVLKSEDIGDERFCTMCCATLLPAPAGARLMVACAGHPGPLVRRSDGTVQTISARGGLLGALPKIGVGNEVVWIDAGDLVVFYTDGITEARNREGRLFGVEGLVGVLSATAGQSADATSDAVIAAVNAFTGDGPQDDVALLTALAF